jgi:cytochrome c
VRRTIAPALLIVATGCFGAVDPIDPKVGQPISSRCVNQDSDPNHDVSFKNQILPILRKDMGIPVGCPCHQPTDMNPIGFEQTGLDLSTYQSLLRGGNNSHSTIVVPGQPCSSVVWQKISPGPPFGARMPFSGPPFLSDAARQLISDWIAEGARDD